MLASMNCCITSHMCDAPCTDRQVTVPPRTVMTHLAAGLAGAAAGGLAAAEAGGNSAALGRTAPPPGRPGDGLGPPTAPAGLGPCRGNALMLGPKQALDRLHSHEATALLCRCYPQEVLPPSKQVPCTNAHSRSALFRLLAVRSSNCSSCFEPLAALGCTLSCLSKVSSRPVSIRIRVGEAIQSAAQCRDGHRS